MLIQINDSRRLDVLIKILEGTWNHGSWLGHITEIIKSLKAMGFSVTTNRLAARSLHLSDVWRWHIQLWWLLRDEARIAHKHNSKWKYGCMTLHRHRCSGLVRGLIWWWRDKASASIPSIMSLIAGLRPLHSVLCEAQTECLVTRH